MCEHELKQALLDIEFLQECNSSVNLALSVTRGELAAANARIAELEQQQFAGQTWVTFDEHMKALKKIKQMEDAIKFDFERFMEFQQRAEQAEAQCVAYKKALDIAMSTNQSPETYRQVKAALEEK